MKAESDDERPVQRSRERKERRVQAGSILRVFLGSILFLVLLAGGAGVALWALGVFGKSTPQSAARNRLIGQWDHISSIDPTRAMSLDIRSDGHLTLIATISGNTVATEFATWEVVTEKTDRLTVKLKWESQATPSDWDIELLPDESLRVNFLRGNSGPVSYKRRR